MFGLWSETRPGPHLKCIAHVFYLPEIPARPMQALKLNCVSLARQKCAIIENRPPPPRPLTRVLGHFERGGKGGHKNIIIINTFPNKKTNKFVLCTANSFRRRRLRTSFPEFSWVFRTVFPVFNWTLFDRLIKFAAINQHRNFWNNLYLYKWVVSILNLKKRCV